MLATRNNAELMDKVCWGTCVLKSGLRFRTSIEDRETRVNSNIMKNLRILSLSELPPPAYSDEGNLIDGRECPKTRLGAWVQVCESINEHKGRAITQ